VLRLLSKAHREAVDAYSLIYKREIPLFLPLGQWVIHIGRQMTLAKITLLLFQPAWRQWSS
jgi:hypothetical protein